MTDHEPIDACLGGYAARWRVVAGAAAAAVAALVVGIRIAQPSDSPRPTGPTVVTPGDVIPWADLPATHPTIPTTTTPASPDPALAEAAPACHADQLAAVSELGAAAGTEYLDVRMSLASGRPCRLEGIPTLEPLDSGQPVIIPVRGETRDDSAYRHPVLVAADAPALLQLTWASDWCTDPVRNDTVRIVLPDNAGSLDVSGFGESPYCNGTAGSGPTPIWVWPFATDRRTEAQVHSIYAGTAAADLLDLQGKPGRTVDFEVTLTAQHDVPLAPCPDFTISMYSPGIDLQLTHGLNCAQVPYRDDCGQPYLPAHTPVSFAMQVTAPDVTVQKFIWSLDVAEPVHLGGWLMVR
jgi:hypothetical protein